MKIVFRPREPRITEPTTINTEFPLNDIKLEIKIINVSDKDVTHSEKKGLKFTPITQKTIFQELNEDL